MQPISMVDRTVFVVAAFYLALVLFSKPNSPVFERVLCVTGLIFAACLMALAVFKVMGGV